MPDSVTFTPQDKVKIQIIEQEITPDTFDDRELPTDLHIIRYSVGGDMYFDAVRAYTKTDIFDAYYDKLRTIGQIHEIRSGLGRIKPKLFGKLNLTDQWILRLYTVNICGTTASRGLPAMVI